MLSRSLIILSLAIVAGGCSAPMEDFTSDAHKFKARFPGKPKLQSQPGPQGTTMQMYAVESRNGVMAVAVADLPLPSDMPPAQVDSALDGAMNGQVRSGGGSLKTSSSIMINGKYPGRELVASITQPKTGQVRSKLFLVKNRLYQVMVMGTDSYATSSQATEFLNSFKMMD